MPPANIQSDLLAPKIEPKSLMKCALGIRTTEIQAYMALLLEEGATVKEMAEKLGKSRPSTQRLLQDLVSKNLAIREDNPIGRGGYEYTYKAVPPEKVKEFMEHTIDAWYHKVKSSLQDFPAQLHRRPK